MITRLNEFKKYALINESLDVIERAKTLLDTNSEKYAIGDFLFSVDDPTGHWTWSNADKTVFATPDFTGDGKIAIGQDVAGSPVIMLPIPEAKNPVEFVEKYVDLIKNNIAKV